MISDKNKEQINDRLIKDIWKLFETEEGNEQNERLIKAKQIEISEHISKLSRKLVKPKT